MSHGVLPAGRSGTVVGELPLHPLVNLLDWKRLGRRALECHEYHTSERQRRLLSVFPVVATISNAQDYVEHLLGRVPHALTRAVVRRFVQTLFALGFSRASAS